MEVVDQIRQVASIIQVASQYTTLRKRGRKYVGLCPFHSEKTPSFTVDEDKQLFHCFGCGVGGDVFSLVMQKENLSFPEALKQLAEKYHVQLPQQTRPSPQVLKLEEKLFKLNESALGFYRKNLLNTREGQIGLDYLKKRKFTDQTIQDLKIGYALNGWASLVDFFKSKSVSPALLEKAGLAVPGQRPGEYYDRFRGRIIFPIFSLTGKVVAFGGRSIGNTEPKYLNSPDTPLYSKGKLLYGLNLTKDAGRDAGEMILVEGYTDFAALYQAGICNVAASLGTALTTDQVGLALRFAPKLILNYDGDTAGKIATSRAISLCFERGTEPQVLVLPENLDPDGFIKKHGLEGYRKLLKQSPSLISFLIGQSSPKDGIKTIDDKVRVANEILKVTLINPNTIKGSEYLKLLSESLRLDEGIVRASLKVKIVDPKEDEKERLLPAEKRLLQIIIESGIHASSVIEKMEKDDFQGLRSEPIFRIICARFKDGGKCGIHELCEAAGPELASHLSKALQEETGPGTLSEALDCLNSLRKISLQNRLKELQTEIMRLEKKGEKDKLPALLYLKQDITKRIIAL